MNNRTYTCKWFAVLFILCFAFFVVWNSSDASASKVGDGSKNLFWDNISYYLTRPIALIFPHIEQRKTIYKAESRYFDIRVEVDEHGLRHLVFLPRKGSQSIFDPNHPDEIISNFVRQSFLALALLETPPKRVLFIGLGGGIMPMFFRRYYPDAQIDIVEIDKIIPEIAEKYFGFQPDSKMSIYISDGCEYINKSNKKYDIIFVDVYDAEKIPRQFTTLKFFNQLKEHLSSDGVVTANLADLGNEKFIPAELNTILQVFPNTFVSVCEGGSNYIPMATTGKTTFTGLKRNAISLDKENRFNLKFQELLKSVMSKKALNEFIGHDAEIIKD